MDLIGAYSPMRYVELNECLEISGSVKGAAR